MEAMIVMKNDNMRTYYVILIIVEAIIFCYLLKSLWVYTPDDAFIYQYGARQLSRGILPNMTPGEAPTNSFGSYAWLVIISIAHILRKDPLFWTKSAGVLLSLFSVAVISLIIRKLSDMGILKSLAFAGIILAFPPFAGCAINGLETMFSTFTLLISLWAVIRDAKESRFHVSTGLLIGFHAISRPDAFIDVALLVMFLLWLRFNERIPWKNFLRVIYGIIPSTIVFVAIRLTYGSPLPVSASVKIPKLVEPNLFGKLSKLLGLFLKDIAHDPVLILLYISVFYFAISYENKHIKLLISGLALTHLAIFFLATDGMGFHRLYMSSLCIAIIPFILIVNKLFTNSFSKAGAIVLLLFLLPTSRNYWRSFVAFQYNAPKSPARWLGAIIKHYKLPDSWLMTEDMGVVPYYADIPTIDSYDRPICNRYRATHENAMDYIRNRNLDFIIIRTPTPDPKGRRKMWASVQTRYSKWFKEGYRRVAVATWNPYVPGATRRGILPSFAAGGGYYQLYVSKRIKNIPEGKVYEFLEKYR
jgi:hypothetical protein